MPLMRMLGPVASPGEELICVADGYVRGQSFAKWSYIAGEICRSHISPPGMSKKYGARGCGTAVPRCRPVFFPQASTFVETVGVPCLMKERSGEADEDIPPFPDHGGGSGIPEVAFLPFLLT